MSAAPDASATVPPDRGPGTPARHPRGLYVLFFSEAWERFSFYGMKGLLVLYLVGRLGYSENDALSVYGTYGFLVYATPLVGGYLADKVLGARKAIILGGISMALGHLAMAFEPLLFHGMGLIIVGNGFFKPNVSTIVGSLYEDRDPRRDAGFTIFYLGINVGAALSGIVCGTLANQFGWHWGFSAATVGMVAGLLVFVWGQKLLGKAGFPPGREATEQSRLLQQDWVHIVAGAAGSVVLVAAVVAAGRALMPWWSALDFWQKLLVVAGVAAAVLLAPKLRRAPAASAPKLTRAEWEQVAVVVIIAMMGMYFWMGFEQAGGTMNLFAEQRTDRSLFGWNFPAPWFQTVNPVVIILGGMPAAMLWERWDRSRRAISTPTKMAIALFLVGLGFVVMYAAHLRSEAVGPVSPLWLISVYVLHTMGELCLSPIGLSLVTKLSPPRLVSGLMGFWFFMTGAAEYVAGHLQGFIAQYGWNVYAFLIASSFAAGLVLLALVPLLKKWMHGHA